MAAAAAAGRKGADLTIDSPLRSRFAGRSGDAPVPTSGRALADFHAKKRPVARLHSVAGPAASGKKKRLPGSGDRHSPGQALCSDAKDASAVDQLMTVTPRRFCAQADSLEPSTAGRSLP